jgi:hypothetical protein
MSYRPLEGCAGDLGMLFDNVEVLREGAFPVDFAVLLEILQTADFAENSLTESHSVLPP